MRNLTNRQKEVLSVIDQYISEKSYPPAIRDIGKIIGVKSSSTVSEFLKQLREKGYVNWEAGQPRTLRIIKTDSQ